MTPRNSSTIQPLEQELIVPVNHIVNKIQNIGSLKRKKLMRSDKPTHMSTG